MPSGTMHDVMRRLRGLVARPALGAETDEELLDRFVTLRDEEAFAALVRRHGPMVLGVCLRLLHHRQDAEDAFQAAFLTLARKGHTIRRRGALPSWLYRVAFRIALRIKARSDRRESPEVLGDVAVEADPSAEAGWRELRPMLDQEVQRLPKKYRTPMILCYLEGKTYEEVASLLGCPKGTVAIRLLRGRQMLKGRLVRRGLMAAAGCVAANAVLPHAGAAVPQALAATTVSAANALAAGAVLTQLVPAGVAALVDEAGRSLWAKHLALASAAALCLGLGGFVSQNAGRFGPNAAAQTVRVAEARPAKAPVEVAETKPNAEPISEAPKAPPVRLKIDAADEPQIVERSRGSWLRSHDGRTLIVIVQTERVPARRRCSGLAVRSRLVDEDRPTKPEPAHPPAQVAGNAGKNRSISLWLKVDRQIDLPGLRILVCTPSLIVRADRSSGNEFIE